MFMKINKWELLINVYKYSFKIVYIKINIEISKAVMGNKTP